MNLRKDHYCHLATPIVRQRWWFHQGGPPQIWLSLFLRSARHPKTVTMGYLACSGMLGSLRVQELCERRAGRPGLPVLMSLMVCVDVKQQWTMNTHWSQFVNPTSEDIKLHITIIIGLSLARAESCRQGKPRERVAHSFFFASIKKKEEGCGLWTLSCDFVHHFLLKH